MRTYITELCEGGHHSTAKSYQDALNSFKRFSGREEIPYTYINNENLLFYQNFGETLRRQIGETCGEQPEGEKDYEVYVASQKEMSLTAAGKRKWVERILFRSIVFIRCTNTLRRKEIVHLPYIKRFMVNIAGERRGGIRPVAFIPDDQMAKLRRIVGPVL